MLDSQLLRDNVDEVVYSLSRRGFELDKDFVTTAESKRKSLQVETQQLQNDRNQKSKLIGVYKHQGQSTDELMQELSSIGTALDAKKQELDELLNSIDSYYARLPNMPHESVPDGKSELDNVEIRRNGTPKSFSFTPKSHDELGDALGLMDFNMAAKLTGSRFVVMRQDIAKLHRALIQFMLDMHTTKHGYHEVYVPYMVNRDSLFGTGQLPKFEEDLFKTNHENQYYLIPTAEIPVTNMVRDEILNTDELPLKWACHTPCFRSEAGSYGKDTKGMIRQHQFEKVELVWIVEPTKSYEALEQLTQDAEAILKALELPYRVVVLCAGDMSASAAKTYDIEVWIPSQNTYREISSCSNMEAFQARRMKARHRRANEKDTTLVHTLNGSGLAVGRTLVAIMENYQNEDGSINIPEALVPYMQGQKCIEAGKVLK